VVIVVVFTADHLLLLGGASSASSSAPLVAYLRLLLSSLEAIVIVFLSSQCLNDGLWHLSGHLRQFIQSHCSDGLVIKRHRRSLLRGALLDQEASTFIQSHCSDGSVVLMAFIPKARYLIFKHQFRFHNRMSNHCLSLLCSSVVTGVDDIIFPRRY
jgi:hypothetical protein